MSSTPRLPLELFAIDGLLTEEERAIRDVVRDFVERRIKPEVADWFEAGTIPARELALEFGELMVRDALHRGESCGGNFREESQTDEGEAQRKDDEFCYVGAWEYNGVDNEPALHKEPLTFEEVHLTQRSYK